VRPICFTVVNKVVTEVRLRKDIYERRPCLSRSDALKDKTHRRQCKMSLSKKLTCKGTLRQVFNRVYRLDIYSFL
jgi:hypothetical protein